MEDILELLGVAGPTLTGVVFGAAVLALFWKGDDAISQQARATLSSWLQRAQMHETPPSWPNNFIAIFDHIFGKHHLSWRCFGMSCLASTIMLAILIMVASTTEDLFAAETITVTNARGDTLDTTFVIALVAGLVFGAVSNFLPDYVSLLETRFVLNRIKITQSQVAILFWLLLDVLATATIFFGIFYSMGFLFLVTVYPDYPGYRLVVWESIELALKFEPAPGAIFSLGVFFYTTFFTSFWIWIYVAARALVRGLAASAPTLRFLQWALPIRSKPIRSIGEVAAVLCCAGYWIFAWLAGVDPVTAP